MVDPILGKFVGDATTNAFIKPLVDSYLIPAIKKQTEAKEDIAKKDRFVENLRHYLAINFDRLKSLSSVIYPGEGVELYDIYEPLTIFRASTKTTYGIKISGYPDRLKSVQKVIISDAAGMGKSTLMRYLFLQSIEKSVGIPIFLELRRVKADKSIASIIRQDLGGLYNEITDKMLLEILSDGKFIVLFDGFDEIQDSSSEVAFKIREFVDNIPNSRVIISSRPEVVESLFPEFKVFKIRPLNTEQAFNIIKKVSQFNEIGEKLIGELKNPRKIDRSISDFLKNPLLTSLLYKAYEHKPTLPEQKHLFFDSVFDALFEAHDYRKDGTYRRAKECGLNSAKFKRVTSMLGHLTMYYGKLEFNKNELLGYIRKIKSLIKDFDFDEEHYFRDIHTAVPLVLKDGLVYRWSHKSMQEYFTAYYISFLTEDPKKTVDRIFSAKTVARYFNTLDIVKEMKPNFLEKNYVLPFLERFVEDFGGIDPQQLELLFYKRIVFYVSKPDSVNYADVISLVNSFEDTIEKNVYISRLGLISENPAYGLMLHSYNDENLISTVMLNLKNNAHAEAEASKLPPEHGVILIDKNNAVDYISLNLDELTQSEYIDLINMNPAKDFIKKYRDAAVESVDLPDIF